MATSPNGSPNEQATIVVPASSANLGCAFDCAALALNLYCRVRAVPAGASSSLQVRYRGPHPDRVPTDDSNLVVQAIRRVVAELESEPGGAVIEIDNQIPVSAGLGASAAAVVAGLMLGALLCGKQPESSRVLRLAAEMEGHPDNAAAACCGGLVFAAQSGGNSEIMTMKTSLPPELKIVAVVPEVALPTEKARAVLPARYDRADAIHNLQRACLLAASCFSGRYDLLPEFFRDRWHQPYRSPLVPGLAACLEIAHPGLLGVFLSGAGPTVLALARHSESEIAAALAEAFHKHDIQAETLFLQADNQGARREPMR